MNGRAKKIVMVAMVVVLVVSSLAILAAIRKTMEAENPTQVIKTALDVKNPVSVVDKNGDGEADYTENLNVDASESEAQALVDTNSDGTPDSLETAESNAIYVNIDNSTKALPASEPAPESKATNVSDDGNETLVNPPNMLDMRALGDVFPGYADQIAMSVKEHRGMINTVHFIRKAAYDLPKPDMAWIRENVQVAKRIDPHMYFGEDGFNGTSYNYTAIRHVEKVDKNHDGNPEFFKEVTYSNLTQDLNGDGTPQIIIIHYSLRVYYDNNSDGNPEYRNFLAAGWVIRDTNQDKDWEHAGILYMHFQMRDNNSDGNPEMLTSRIFYREVWDENQDGIYEHERGMAEIGWRYDNNSNGVFEKGELKLFGYSAYRNSTTKTSLT